MANATAPVRSYRRIYTIPDLVRRKNENGDYETADGYVKMKKSIADLFGDTLVELAYDATAWYYTREVNGQNVQFRKNLGGNKGKSVVLVAKGTYTVTEITGINAEGEEETEETNFKSLTIGLPAGSRLGKFLDFLEGSDIFDSTLYMYTPDRKRIDLNSTAP